MTPYFNTPLKRVALVIEARSWLRTPFVPHGRAKGKGVDCVSLLAEIYIACGFMSDWRQPAYFVGAGQHRQNSALESWLQEHGHFEPMPNTTRPEPGDLLTFTMGRVDHHVGIKVDSTRFLHATPTAGVIEADLRDPTYAKRLRAIWRPMAA